MPEVRYSKNQPTVQFVRSEDLIAVRTFSKKPLGKKAVLPSEADVLLEKKAVLAFPEAGVEVYQVPVENTDSLESLKDRLEGLHDVRFAGSVFVDVDSGEPAIYTENVFIKFIDSKSEDECIREIIDAKLRIKKKIDYATNAFFAGAPEGTGEKIFEIALALSDRDDVEYCYPEIVTRKSFRAIGAQQWHLMSTNINGNVIDASANVAAAHEITKGANVTIAIIDDGVDIDHAEFQSAGKVVAPRDVSQNTFDPRPKDPDPDRPDDHGTACAGVACADGIFGASGVAPLAKLMPIRDGSGLGSDQTAEAFKWAADHGADIISCSWGPPDGRWHRPGDTLHKKVWQLPPHIKDAIDYAVNNGRGGKGCVILFAAGNGNESVDNDGYASYEKVIAVAACNDRGKRSVYSDFGKAIWCSFPSGDFEYLPSNPKPLTPGIWTTDRTGQKGYNGGSIVAGDAEGNYTNEFSGTSSSCPGVAGVAALILSVAPFLTWEKVKDVLRESCEQIDQESGSYVNDRSDLYGYGRINAEKAVKLAKEISGNRYVTLPEPVRVRRPTEATKTE